MLKVTVAVHIGVTKLVAHSCVILVADVAVVVAVVVVAVVIVVAPIILFSIRLRRRHCIQCR